MINVQMMITMVATDMEWSLGEYIASEGGYYMGDIYVPDDGLGGNTYSIISAPKTSGQNSSIQWKTGGTSTAGTVSETNGKANTDAMSPASHPAAAFCLGLTIGGHADWYFPAKDELELIYTNHAFVVGPDAFDVDATFYWASTQNGSSAAWASDFRDGTLFGYAKTGSARVRACRRVLKA